MYQGTAGPQNESSSTDRLVVDMVFATRSKAKVPPKRIAEPNRPPVKGKVKSSAQYQGILYSLPYFSGEKSFA